MVGMSEKNDSTPAVVPAAPAAGRSPIRDFVFVGLVTAIVGFIGGWFARETSTPPPAIPAAAAVPAAAPQMPATAEQPEVSPQLREKIAELEKLSMQDPENLDIALQLGHGYYDAGAFDRAIPLYEKVLPTRPNDANLITDMGVAYRNVGQIEKALELFRRAQKADASHWQSRYNEAIVLSFEQGKKDQAKKILAELRSLPDPKVKEAVERLERAIDAHGGGQG
jgi:tetratricopeptide (TPR) repeat protein